MPSVSILHAPRDEALGDKIAAALASAGLAATRVDSDAGMNAAGLDEDDSAAIVVWTEAAEKLVRLHEQAMLVMLRGALVPVAVGGAMPPGGFENLPPVDLSGWTGAADDPRWRFVLEEIQIARQRLGLQDGAVWAAPENQGAGVAGDAAAGAMHVREGRTLAAPRGFSAQGKSTRRFSAKEVAIGATAGLVMMTVATALLAPLVLPTPPAFRPQDLTAQTTQAVPAIPDPSQETPSALASLRVESKDIQPPEIIVPGAPEAGAPDSDVMGSLIASVIADAPPQTTQLAAIDPVTDDTAKNANTPNTSVFIDCAGCPEMTALPAGSFQMGAAPGETANDKTESPRREVTIEKAFALGAKEVTYAQWDACVADGGCTTAPPDHGWGRGDRPVVSVSYPDALAYTAWLSAKTGKPYRLPSEAEWEYAARAGGEGAFSLGSGVTAAQANFNGQFPYRGPKGTFRARTIPVASFAPNAFGLFDMHGNAWEWTADCWKASHAGAPSDGSAVETGDCAKRVLKGGAWNTGAWRLRSAHRIGKSATAREFDNGFRVARDLG